MAIKVTSKQRAYLRSLAMKEHAVVQVGKGGVTPDVTAYADEALSARELIKVDVLKNAGLDVRDVGETLAGRTNSLLVQTMGRKITLYRPAEKPVIKLPKASAAGNTEK